MSRLVVKNLPNKVKLDKLKQQFSEIGEVTDLQLKYTPGGKFRKFAFIGFKTGEQAQAALEHFNNTFFNASRITVEFCSELGSSEKPKAWSKYSHDSSAFKKIHKKNEKEEKEESKSKEKKNKVDKIIDNDLLDKIKQHKDEPEFREFLEIHEADKILNIDKEEDEETVKEDELQEENEPSENNIANAPISDEEYLRLKTKRDVESVGEQKEKTKPAKKEKKFQTLFTIKIKNLPPKVTKGALKELLKPLKPASIRRKQGDRTSGLAFVGFKTQKEVRQALVKNKTFIKGKQIFISEYIDRNVIENQKPDRWKEQEESLKIEESIAESGKIFLRNLSYSVKENEIEEIFSKFGPVTEVIVPIDKFTRKTKGFGIVTFMVPENAVTAYTTLDGTIFQGRMLHLLPGKTKNEEDEDSQGGYKVQKEKKLKKTAGSSHNWNTLFLGQNAVADIIAETYKASKQDVLTGNEAAVRLALGETQIVASTRTFLEKNGVHLDAFNQEVKKRSKTVILVKNLPANTSEEEIREKFAKFGILGKVLLPPSGITAIVEFEEPSEARAAFTKLAYTKFKHMPLYLEWAPDNTFQIAPVEENKTEGKKDESGEIEKEKETEEELEPDTTLFVKNLNFDTCEKELTKHFRECGKLLSVTVARKKDPKEAGKMLSMGYGFVQFYTRSSLNEALIRLQGSTLDGHTLELKRSNRTLQTQIVDTRKKTNVKNQTGKKIIVRNIPFQANIKEITQLFKTFGELKFVRLPKKMVGTGPHRGFAFVEYVTKNDAKQAMKTLCQSTHLYGRRLVLEWAQEEEDIEDIRKRTAKHFHLDEAKKSKKGTVDFEIEEDEEEI